jgi:hypothetical protein
MRTLVLAVAVALTAAIVNPVDSHAATTATVSTDPCPAIILDDTVTDATIAELVAAGWYGDATDGTEALYSPSCQELDTWPLGASMDAVGYTLAPLWDVVAATAWTAHGVASGWTLLPADAITDPDGTPHAPCLALVGPTTQVVCADGHTATS